MSRQVYFPVAIMPQAGDEAPVVHLVLPGTNECAICGVSRHRMRFLFTPHAELFEPMAQACRETGEPLAMFDPAVELFAPMVPCERKALSS